MTARLRSALLAVVLSAAPAVANAAPALWEVSDGDSKVWLFGSMHILPKDVVWQTDLLDLVLHEADKVYFECDLGIFSLLAVTMQVSREALAASAAPVYWTDELSDEDYDYADDTVAAYGLDLERLAILPPWLAELTVTAQAVRAARADINTEEGVDVQLLRTLPLRRPGAILAGAWRQGPASVSGAAQGLRRDDRRHEVGRVQGEARPLRGTSRPVAAG